MFGAERVSDKARDMTRNKGILVESCVILTWNTSLLVALIVIYLLFSFAFQVVDPKHAVNVFGDGKKVLLINIVGVEYHLLPFP